MVEPFTMVVLGTVLLVGFVALIFVLVWLGA